MDVAYALRLSTAAAFVTLYSFNHMICVSAVRSERFSSSFTGSDTHRFFHLGHKDLTVADFSSLGLFQNRFDSALRSIVGDHNLEFNFWKKIDCVLGAAVDLAVSFLTAKTFYLA